MISCQSCRELLPEFSMGELEARDQRKVKFHLQKCPKCALEMAEYRRVWMALPFALDPIDPPETAKVQLMDRVKASRRVRKSDRRDRYADRPGRRSWSNQDAKIKRYIVAAVLLIGLFGFSNLYFLSPSESAGPFASQPEIGQRVRSLAGSMGRGNQLVEPDGTPNFVYVQLRNGAAYESLDSRPEAYAIWNRITDKWHVFADSMPFGDQNSSRYKLWLQNKDGDLLASKEFVLREFGNTSLALQSSVKRQFARALITLESDGAAKRPSSAIVFEADLLKPTIQVEELEF